MNGPEHYREAERLLELSFDEFGAMSGEKIAAAQAHATLALAAATALNGPSEAGWPAWREVAGGAS